MSYQNQVRKVLNNLLPELLEMYNKFEVITKGKKQIKDIKDLEYKMDMFVTEEGKIFDKKTRESLIFETLPFIRPLRPMMQPTDLISYVLGILNLLFGEEYQLTELDKPIISKRVIINLAGIIEDYYRAIHLRTTQGESQEKIHQNLNRMGLRGKENLVLNNLEIKALFEELEFKDLPFFKNYEKFVDHRNLVHTSKNPEIDPEIKTLTEQLREDLFRQVDEQNFSLYAPILKRFVEKILPIVTLGFYYHLQTIPYLVILDHCYNCWLSYHTRS